MATFRVYSIGVVIALSSCTMAPPKPVMPPVIAPPTMATATTTVATAHAASSNTAPASAASSTPGPAIAMVAAPTPPVVQAVSTPAPIPQPKPHHVPHKAPATTDALPATGPAEAASLAQISGHVTLKAGRDQQVTPGESADTLVYFVPSSGNAHIKPGHYTVYTHNRDFSPEAMAVPAGSLVTFVNLDDVRHNVFSVTPGSTFDLGYQGTGEKASQAFTRPGLVLVSCKVHRSMELDLLVVPTSYITKVNASGDFVLRGLPPGAGTLYFWNPRAQPTSQAVVAPTASPVAQQLLVTRPRMTTEMNNEPMP